MVSMDPALEQRRGQLVERVSLPVRPRFTLPRLSALRGLLLPLLILAVWQVAVNREIYSRGQLPAPLDVLAAGQELQNIGVLVPNVVASLQRVGVGWGIGAVVAIALGLLVGFSRSAEAYLAPTIQALRAVPSLAWVPLFVLWMGIGETPKLLLIAVGAFFPVYTNVVAGV
ncbi:MAG: hypothetical protein KC442_15255, partial [Thermomicrobiales bacterium]|nr:hypothetical protein [Thermomicrobiales bacterium]